MFPKIGIPQNGWFIYNGKSFWNGWFGVITIFGNIHIIKWLNLLKGALLKSSRHMVQHGPAFQLQLLSQYPATGSREGPCETESRTRMICEVTQCNSQFLDKKCESKHGFTFKYPKFASPKIRLAAFCRCSAAAAATWGRMGWSQCQILMLRVSLKTYLFTKDLPDFMSWL